MSRPVVWTFLVLLAFIAIEFPLQAQQPVGGLGTSDIVSTDQFSGQVTAFLGGEIAAHVADIHSLDPPQERVVGALTTGEFSWGTFMRALASYSALADKRTVEGRDVPKLIGQIGLIEAKNGGKSFAQLYAGISLRTFGTDLATNSVWQSLSPAEQASWRSLLDPRRFYNPQTREVIDLPQNYFGVAARVATMDYQLGIIHDRRFVDDVLDRAAEQFTRGNLYADDDYPNGRFDRYSNEYARYVYEAAENVGRKDILSAMEPTLRAQMRTWWDLLSPDGYGYPWGRSLGDISYMDTIEIVAFLAKHPQFRPAPLIQLASAYYVAWQSLQHDYLPGRHLLNTFGFGRGNYSYIDLQREWQQTAALFGKVSGAHKTFTEAMGEEKIASFPSTLKLSSVARFEYFRKGPPSAGVWLVRHGALRFALPITGPTHPGVSDYLPAPYGLPGFSNPVEQFIPVITPYLELEDGRVVVASGPADEVAPSADGMSLRVVWKHWAILGSKAGAMVDLGLTTEVTWKIRDDSLVRSEALTASAPMRIRHFWVVVPTTANICSARFDNGLQTYRCDSSEGSLEISITQSDWPLRVLLRATGNSNLGRGSRGPVPLYVEYESGDKMIQPGTEAKWSIALGAIPASTTKNGSPNLSNRLISNTTSTTQAASRPDYLH